MLMLAVSGGLTALIIPFGSRLIALFGAGDEAVSIGAAFFTRLASFYIVFGIYNAIRGYLEGIGDMVLSSFIGIGMLAVRIVCSYAMADLFGNMVIAYAEGICWVIGLGMFSVRMKLRDRNLGLQGQNLEK